jgi:hypothetical protein
MIRLIIDGILIFLIPFAAYALYQAWAEKDPKAAFRMAHGPLIILTIAGLLLCILAIIVSEWRAPHGSGGYIRARWEDGRLIQGQVKP